MSRRLKNQFKFRHIVASVLCNFSKIVKLFGGNQVADIISGDFFVFFSLKAGPHRPRSPLGFRTGYAERPAPQMQPAFSPGGAVKSKLVKKVNMNRPEFLAAQIPIGHQIFGGFDFMNSRTHRQKWGVKAPSVEGDELVIFFPPLSKNFPASLFPYRA